MRALIAKCAVCEGQLFMLTCHHAHGTGHDWALAAICVGCQSIHWGDEGCPACRANLRPNPQRGRGMSGTTTTHPDACPTCGSDNARRDVESLGCLDPWHSTPPPDTPLDQTTAPTYSEDGMGRRTENPDPEGARCVCGEPDTPGIHRTDGPCYVDTEGEGSERFCSCGAVLMPGERQKWSKAQLATLDDLRSALTEAEQRADEIADRLEECIKYRRRAEQRAEEAEVRGFREGFNGAEDAIAAAEQRAERAERDRDYWANNLADAQTRIRELEAEAREAHADGYGWKPRYEDAEARVRELEAGLEGVEQWAMITPGDPAGPNYQVLLEHARSLLPPREDEG